MTDDGVTGVGRRSALALVGAGVSGVCTIATLLIASRSLTSVEAGEFFVAISLFAIVQGLCSFGAETGLQFYVPTMIPADARRLMRTVAITSAVVGAAVAAIVLLGAPWFGDLLAKGETADDASAASIVRAVALVLPFAGLYEVTMGSLRASDRVLISVTLDRIIRPVVQVAAMLVAALLGGGSRAALYAWALPNVAAVLVAIVLLARIRLRGNQRNELVTTSTFWRYTWPRSVARVAQTLTQRLDVIILAAVYPLEEAGIYGTVSRCMIAGVFIATAVRQAVQPQLRRLIVRGDQSAVKTMYGITTTWLVLVTWPAYIAMLTHAPLVMSAFGPRYVRGGDALMILCAAMLVASACGLVDVVLLMLGRSWLSTINVLVALALNIVLNLILAPEYGMVGSAIAWFVAILATNLLPLWQTSRVGLHPGGRPLATVTAVASLTIGLPLLVERLVLGVDLVPFAVTAAGALVLYAVVLHAVRRDVMLDRLVADVRTPRRSRIAAAGQG
jgi:O-antigen/teichoic acid export membrane protein